MPHRRVNGRGRPEPEQGEDRAKLALQCDGEVALHRAGGDDDAVDDLADGCGCLRRVVGMVERCGHTLDPAPEGFGDAGMDVGNVLRRVAETGGETVLPGLQFGQPVGQGTVPAALLDDTHDLGDRLRGLGGGAALPVEPVGLQRITEDAGPPAMSVTLSAAPS